MRYFLLILSFLLFPNLWLVPAPYTSPASAVAGEEVLAPEPAEAEKACFKVLFGKYSGSGVCVATDGTRSLVLTCNHIFAEQPAPGAPFPLADYPLAVIVLGLDETVGEVYRGKAVAGLADHDLALVVVEGKLPALPLASKDSPVGTEVRHRGIGSGWTRGKVLPAGCVAPACSTFVATAQAIPGDSGSGVYNLKGEVVALTCGRIAWAIDAPLRGTPVSALRKALEHLKDKVPGSLRRAF